MVNSAARVYSFVVMVQQQYNNTLYHDQVSFIKSYSYGILHLGVIATSIN